MSESTERFFGDWTDRDSIVREFYDDEERVRADLVDAKVVVAAYGSDVCGGTCYVLYEKGDQLYEMHDSHDSYDGMRWRPREVIPDVLRHIVDKGHFLYGSIGEKVRGIVKSYLGEVDHA